MINKCIKYTFVAQVGKKLFECRGNAEDMNGRTDWFSVSYLSNLLTCRGSVLDQASSPD